jgi:hypothetical protein
MKKRAFRIFKLGIVLVIIGMGILLHFLLPKLIIDTRATSHKSIKIVKDQNTELVKFASFDTTEIHGLFVRAREESRGTIILLHGIRGYKEHFTGLAS